MQALWAGLNCLYISVTGDYIYYILFLFLVNMGFEFLLYLIEIDIIYYDDFCVAYILDVKRKRLIVEIIKQKRCGVVGDSLHNE